MKPCGCDISPTVVVVRDYGDATLLLEIPPGPMYLGAADDFLSCPIQFNWCV